VVLHQGYGKIVLGEFNRVAQPRTREISEIFKQSGVSCEVVDALDEGLWEKLVWNIPFNGLGVAASAGPNALESGKIPEVLGHTWTTDRLLADTGWEERVRELMREIINIAAAKNIGLKPELADRMINNTRSMGAYRPSTVIDFEQGRPFELESMFLEPLRQARAASVSVPRIEALCIVLKKLASYLPRP
jgi:2-dehydropantoate 2-reductase